MFARRPDDRRDVEIDPGLFVRVRACFNFRRVAPVGQFVRVRANNSRVAQGQFHVHPRAFVVAFLEVLVHLERMDDAGFARVEVVRIA